MEKSETSEILAIVDTPTEVGPLSNAARLRPHLTANGLASVLLDAWLGGSKVDAHKRMAQTINDFYTEKQASSDTSTVKKD